LKRIPLSTIKLDRAFVRDVHEDLHSQAIARTVFTLARALSVDVIAEGVEDPQQIAFLSEEGCTKVQGYFYARPAPFAEVLDALTRATTDG
jgi:EAL domain-containing protein (putative c-di-GMP-specific phosphodiesterase class I)